MGKHRTQREKLLDLEQRLERGETIANREIRAAFGKQDYDYYEIALGALTEENDSLRKAPERTQAQRDAEMAIKQCLMLTTRAWNKNAKSKSVNNWEEIAQERLEALTQQELHEMNYWMKSEVHGGIELDLSAKQGNEIYKTFGQGSSVAGLKQQALKRAITAVLDKDGEQRTSKSRDRKLGADKLAAVIRRMRDD